MTSVRCSLFVLDQVIEQGWVLVATDYTGLGTAGPHPYLIGPGEAYSVLDAVRAGRSIPGLALDSDVVVCGVIPRAAMPRSGPVVKPQTTRRTSMSLEWPQ
ncbi:MAG: hypothetical protein JOZ81_01675 [Chloroflexi bacterium]|nr:hypothetical protein [Chloroflexota bacterium]